MKKGFTLIELLAVIVILAIIALITIPIIADSISESREKSAVRAAELYVQAVDQELAKQNLDGTFTLEDGCYEVNSDGDLKVPNGELEISAKNKPSSGTVCIENLAVSKVRKLNLNEKKVSSKGDKYTVLDPKVGYEVGEEVYFDVDKGKACTKSEYESSKDTYSVVYFNSQGEKYYKDIQDYGNSKSGYNGIDIEYANQNSCLKFYVLSVAENKVTLILDHNTTISQKWNSNGVNNVGPLSALEQLDEDTADWNGTEPPTSYTYTRDEDACFDETEGEELSCDEIEYTISYSGKKARLITAEEVATIANVNLSDMKTKNFKLDYGMSTSEIKRDLAWLYDRSSRSLQSYAKFAYLNLAIIDDYGEQGYWTATASSVFSEDDIKALAVNVSGDLHAEVAGDGERESEFGIRPVIEVSKSNL